MEVQPLEADADVTALPHGTKVGFWRLKGCRGRGAYGTVMGMLAQADGALRATHERAGCTAT